MQSASLTSRFEDLQIDAIPDAPRDIIPKEEKEEVAAVGCSPVIVSLHNPERVSITEVTKNDEEASNSNLRSQPLVPKESAESTKIKRSSGRRSSGQRIDMGRQFPPLQIPFSVPGVGSGGGNVVLVNQSNGVQVGDTIVYNSTNVTSPSSAGTRFGGVSPKPKKIDAEEKCLEDLRSVSDRITTDEISAISNHIGVNWKVLGRRLKYTDGQLDQFYLNFEKLQMREVVYQLLLDWKRTRTSKATIKSLAKHLYKSNEVAAVIELHKIKFNDS